MPWYEGEVARWHILSARQAPQLVFNCHHVPEVCVSRMTDIGSRNRLMYVLSKTCVMALAVGAFLTP